MDHGAIVEILENPRYEGAMSTIQGVTDIVDGGFMAVITFLSFFIISVALLRNVFAGVYCAFPRFWDQVADAHKAQETKTLSEMVQGVTGAYKSASMSTIKQGIMSILPNIKALTDFDDNTCTAKSYFIKAIPQMIMVVIIGVFIFNGYYRDATALVAGTGAELLERTLLSVDPIKVFDTITDTAGRPSFATDDAATTLGKVKNDVTVEIYSEIISTYTDIKTAEDKAVLAANIDNAVKAIFGDNNGAGGANATMSSLIMEDTKWKTTARVDMGKNFDPSNAASDSENVKMFCFKINLANTPSNGSHANIMFDSTSPEYANEWYIRVRVKLERQSVQADKAANGTFINGLINVGATADKPTEYTVDTTANGSSGTFKATQVLPEDSTDTPAEVDIKYTYENGTYKFYCTTSSVKAGEYTINGSLSLNGYDTTPGKRKTVPIKFTKIKIVTDGLSSWSGECPDYTGGGDTFNVIAKEAPSGD